MENYLILAILTIILGLLSALIYRRFFPVLGIPCGRKENGQTVVLDIRDYNEIELPQSEIQIPYPYLKRFKEEIPKQQLHVIANDRMELNLGLRFLLGQGYQVASYEINNCPCAKLSEK